MKALLRTAAASRASALSNNVYALGDENSAATHRESEDGDSSGVAQPESACRC